MLLTIEHMVMFVVKSIYIQLNKQSGYESFSYIYVIGDTLIRYISLTFLFLCMLKIISYSYYIPSANPGWSSICWRHGPQRGGNVCMDGRTGLL